MNRLATHKFADGHNKYRLTIETTAKKDIKKGEKIKIKVDDDNGKIDVNIISLNNKAKYFLKK